MASPSTPIRDVALSADGNFVRPLGVTLASLSQSHTSSNLVIHVAYEGIGIEDRERISACAAPHEVRWVEPDLDELDGIEIDLGLTRATLFRLRLGELLPAVSTVLYLDADTIVNQDLKNLLDTPLDGSVVAAARDSIWGEYGHVGGPDWLTFDIASGSPYFNAGVMIIDLHRARTEQLGRRCLELNRQRGLNDQDALNLLTRERWVELHPRWNVQSNHFLGRSFPAASTEHLQRIADAIDDPAIVHLTAAWAKPWRGGLDHPWSRRWLEILDTTPYRGWRPTMEAEGRSSRPPMIHRARTASSRFVRQDAAPRLSRAVKSSDSLAWRRHRTLDMIYAASDSRVAGGIFQGLLVPPVVVGSDHIIPAQLLGTYCQESQAAITALTTRGLQQVVLLGCRDVLLPAGIARLSDTSSVKVIDGDPITTKLWTAIADANGVADRVASAHRLDASSAPPPDLLIADDITDLESVFRQSQSGLTRTSMLVQGGRRPDPTTSPRITSLFSATHDLHLIRRSGRDPFDIPLLSELDDLDKWLAVDDELDHVEHWLWFVPLEAPSS